ncbi:hypothetical protein BCR34DRAFT_594164 [Clohesyomyces aquaticus]|uniref:Uncharacterized protein n=1 Tax=Clohesyomyces aquaticus TaxID=1231657 RepID=A0A1Y1YBJ6_9PLEO|nr:hypothetical protein BCR34DRAFT_594164 [Clohesyomyces aquaticus]
MDQTIEMLSPNSLLDAEGDIESNFGEMPQHQDDAAATQSAGVLFEIRAIGASQANGHASQIMEPCLLEHPVALTASQTSAEVDQAMDSAPEPAVPEPSRAEADQAMTLESEVTKPSRVEADQAMASTLEPEVSGPSHAEATMTSTSEQESEPRNDDQTQKTEDSTQPSEPPHRVISATEPEATITVQETNTQTVKRDLRLSVESPATEERHGGNNEVIVSNRDDSHNVQSLGSASTSLSGCRATSEDTETTSVVPHTTSRN